MNSPLFCMTAWLNLGTGNVTLEMNREPSLQDRVGIRKDLELFLEQSGAGFSLHTDKARVLMEPTPHTRQLIDIDRDFVRDMLHELGLGNDVPVKKKLTDEDTLNPGIRQRFIPIPREYLSAS